MKTNKVVLISDSFRPDTGGIAEWSWDFIQRLRDHVVSLDIITRMPTHGKLGVSDFANVRIYYKLSILKEFLLIFNAEKIIFSQISLKHIFFPILLRKDIIVISHTSSLCYGKNLVFKELIKYFLISKVRSVSVSDSLKRYLPMNTIVIPNGVDTSLFKQNHDIPRLLDFIFVGRIIEAKGLLVLLKAILLCQRKYRQSFSVTIVGVGPSLGIAKRFVEINNFISAPVFLNEVPHAQLPNLMQMHRFLVAPSIWEEPFGLVAIEGLLSGCIPLVSEFGGLKEATKGRSITFPNNDYLALSELLWIASTKYNQIHEEIFSDFSADQFSADVMFSEYKKIFNL